MATVQSTSSLKPVDLVEFVNANRVDLNQYEALYKHLHANPELSHQEGETAAFVQKHLEGLGIREIQTGIGGVGLAALIHNGEGKTVLLRSELDGLPVKEDTGLAYASTKTQVDKFDGQTKPTMHACGHDVHMTSLLAAAETLSKTKAHWTGTAIILFQPAEEHMNGAQRMVDDGLYDRIPVPDVVLGQHVFPYRAGYIGLRPGPIMAAMDTLKITFYGRGAHASMPHTGIDPIVLASSVVLRLQTIVSREVAPADTAVVTVGVIRGGSAANIISDSCYINVNVRSFDASVREGILASIERICKAESEASNAPKEPKIEKIVDGPANVNDKDVTKAVSDAFERHFGDTFNGGTEQIMGSEDFPALASSVNRPSCFWALGGADPKKYDDAKKRGKLLEEIATNHSPFFAPVPDPTLKAGMDALVTAAMTFLGKQ